MEAGERKRGTPAWRLPIREMQWTGPPAMGDLCSSSPHPGLQVCPCWE